ncbi:FAD binding domain-containing protein [Bacillus sp. JJ1562]|uniref:FAD binding domain-containing protein n=1 Tax=Bacillus sp. JJ1562 TaxID=3122960 RepID=UPI003001B0D1
MEKNIEDWRNWFGANQGIDEPYPFTILHPNSVSEACTYLSKYPNNMVFSGGTEVVNNLKRGIITPEYLISLSRVPELKGIKLINNEIHIGSATVIKEIINNNSVKVKLPVLYEACLEVGVEQIRNQGTIGGNILQAPRCLYYLSGFPCFMNFAEGCPAEESEQFEDIQIFNESSYCKAVLGSDLASALVALDARIEIANLDGLYTRKLSSIYSDINISRKLNNISPFEIITKIIIPIDQELTGTYIKKTLKNSGGIGTVGLAITMSISNNQTEKSRIVFSGVAAQPFRASFLERIIENQSIYELNEILKTEISNLKTHDVRKNIKLGICIRLLEEALKRIQKHQLT